MVNCAWQPDSKNFLRRRRVRPDAATDMNAPPGIAPRLVAANLAARRTPVGLAHRLP